MEEETPKLPPARKPWAAAIHEESIKQNPGMWADPGSAARFRMFSGAIWIFAVAVFLLVGLLAG